MKDIKPCPFCGHKAYLINRYMPDTTNTGQKEFFYHIRCMTCGATMPEEEGEEELIDRWNKRSVGILCKNCIYFLPFLHASINGEDRIVGNSVCDYAGQKRKTDPDGWCYRWEKRYGHL